MSGISKFQVSGVRCQGPKKGG